MANAEIAALIARLRRGEPDRYPDAWRAADIVDAAAEYVAAHHDRVHGQPGGRGMRAAGAIRREHAAWVRLVALVAPAGRTP